MRLKGTVSVISSDLPVLEWHVQFTTITLKPLFDQEFHRYSYLYSRKLSKCLLKPRECTLAQSVQCTL